jgi:hypothetical protein
VWVRASVLPPGHKSRLRCPFSALLRQPDELRVLWRIALRGKARARATRL